MSKQAGTTKNISTTGPWPNQTPYLNTLLGGAAGLYHGEGPQYFPGNTVAGLAPAEIEAQNYASKFASGIAAPMAERSQQALDRTLGGEFLDVANNPLVQNVVRGSTTDVANQFLRETLPGIRSGAQLAGQLGSSRQGIAEGLASGEASRNAMNTAAGINLGAYNTGLGNLMQGLNLAPQVQQMGMLPTNMLSSVGGQNRALDQAQIDAAMAKWQYEQNLPYVKLNEFANMVSKPLGGQSETQTVYPQVSGLQQGIGTGLQSVALFSQVWNLLKSMGLFGG